MIHSRFFGLITALGLASALVFGPTNSRAEVLCTAESVAGAYGFLFDGFVGQSKNNGDLNIFLNKRERGVGTLVLDANGDIEVSVRGFAAGDGRFDGEGPFEETFEGTWSVEDDCTGDILLDEDGFDVAWIFVAVENASDLFIVSQITLGKIIAERLQVAE